MERKDQMYLFGVHFVSSYFTNCKAVPTASPAFPFIRARGSYFLCSLGTGPIGVWAYRRWLYAHSSKNPPLYPWSASLPEHLHNTFKTAHTLSENAGHYPENCCGKKG